jgi:hypothetical protein
MERVMSMVFRACVAVWGSESVPLVVVYVVTVTVVIVLAEAGWLLPALIAAVAGAGWAAGPAPRPVPAVAAR